MLDGDRQELRSIKNELDDLKRLAQNNEQQAPRRPGQAGPVMRYL